MHVMGSVSPANDNEGFSFLKEDVAVAEAMSPPFSSGFSHIIENGVLAVPPPPPPPPPPPIPPLLPLNPGQRDNTVDLKKKRRVRSFFWKTIPEEQVKGRANLWTQGQVQQHFQINVQEVEELFGQNDCQSDATAPPTRGGKTRVSFRETKQEVSILDPRRGLNIAIFLKQFKRSNQALVDDIHRGNSESFGAEPLRDLLKLLPEKDEVKKLKAYRGDVSKLPLADSFVYLLIQVPSYSVRIESMLLKEEFPAACEAIKQDFRILRSATKELMCCEELHAVLHLVLQAGNILNAGGYAGNAVGFKLSSLLSLADTKSNKPGMNLLHFVALEAEKKDKKLLEFPLKLSNVQAASRISLETLDTELQSLTSRTRSVEENIQKDTELLQQLDGFLQSATSSLCSLRGSQQTLKKDGSQLIDFICEDRDAFRLDDCFSIFYTFCTRFTSAVKENTEREAKEAARRQRLQEEEVKRHSWAGGEEVHGAVGLRCSSETDMSTIISKDETGLLLALLTPKSQPRWSMRNHLSTRGRAWNSHRTRNPPSSSPFTAAERELNSFLETSNDLKVPRQRGKGDSRTDFPSASARTMRLSPEKVPAFSQVDLQATSVPPKTSSNTNCTDSTYISSNDARNQVKTADNANEVTVKSTSDQNQQSDHNNNKNHQPERRFISQEVLSHPPTSSCVSRNTADEQNIDHNSNSNAPVLLERSTPFPELKALNRTTIQTSHNEGPPSPTSPTRHQQGGRVTTGLDEDSDRSQTKVTNISQDVMRPSPLQREEEQEDKVIVWCVTGVCEAAGENTQTENHQYGGKSQGQNQHASSTPSRSSDPHLDGVKSEAVPISSQPLSRCSDSSLLVSSPGRCPTEPESAGLEPGLTVEAAEEDRRQRTEEAPDPRSKNKTTLKQTAENASSAEGKAKLANSSKQSTKNLLNSKPRSTGTKPATSNETSTSSRSIHTLSNSENQSLRRVVPITRSNPAASSVTRLPKEPTGLNRTSFRTTSLASSNINSISVRRGVPLSQRSKELKDQAAAREQNQDSQRRPSSRKALMKPKSQTEEKMCLSKLRALTQGGGGGSVSAPVTPLHKTQTPSSSALPGFARNTASSSFRRTKTPLGSSHSPNTSSPKASPKTSSCSSSALLNAPPSTLPCTGSLRVTASSRSSSPQRSQSVRSSTRPSFPLTPSRDRQQNDSRSPHLSKASRPSWR